MRTDSLINDWEKIMIEDDEIKDFDIKVQVRNNHLLERRKKAGHSRASLCREANLCKSLYGRLEACKIEPITQAREWRKIARDLAIFYSVSPDELFPAAIIMIKNPEAAAKMSAREVSQWMSLENPYDKMERLTEGRIFSNQLLDKANLTERERILIECRYGLNGRRPETLEELVPEFKVSRERVRQIEKKVIRKLRRAANSPIK